MHRISTTKQVFLCVFDRFAFAAASFGCIFNFTWGIVREKSNSHGQNKNLNNPNLKLKRKRISRKKKASQSIFGFSEYRSWVRNNHCASI